MGASSRSPRRPCSPRRSARDSLVRPARAPGVPQSGSLGWCGEPSPATWRQPLPSTTSRQDFQTTPVSERSPKEWLAKDLSGRTLLDQLLADPEAGAQALAERLRGGDVPALAATWVSGGNIGKLVAIARAERVSIAEPAYAPPTPHQLPHDVAFFTGRETELAHLRALLPEGRAGTVVISAIAGTAGVGKTALALHFAHELLPRFDDLQLFVNLHGYDARQ